MASVSTPAASPAPRAAAAPKSPATPSPTLVSTVESPLSLQGIRRVVHVDGSTQEDKIAHSVVRNVSLTPTPLSGARVVYGSPKLVSAYRTLPTEFVSQTESGYYKVAGELVDEKVYEGRKLQAELVDEKVYEGRALVGELVEETVRTGKAAIIAVEEVPQPRVDVAVRHLPEVVRSVKVSEHVHGAAAEKVTVNTYVTVGEPKIYDLPPATVLDASPIFLGGKAYVRTTSGFSPIHTQAPRPIRVATSVASSSPVSSMGSPAFYSPAHHVRTVSPTASPEQSSIVRELKL